MEKVKFYMCEKCGCIQTVIGDNAPLDCCEGKVKLLVPDSVEADRKKHIPIYERRNNVIDVTVGEIPHPMIPEHYIMWVALVTDDDIIIEDLCPGMEPKVVFANVDKGMLYAYCNIHGLWQNEII